MVPKDNNRGTTGPIVAIIIPLQRSSHCISIANRKNANAKCVCSWPVEQLRSSFFWESKAYVLVISPCAIAKLFKEKRKRSRQAGSLRGTQTGLQGAYGPWKPWKVLEFRKPFSRSWKGLENCKNQEYPWKDLEFWRNKLDLRWKQHPRVEQRGTLSKIFGEKLGSKHERGGRRAMGIDAKADGMRGRVRVLRVWVRTSIARRWDLHHGLGLLSKASNWRWKWQEGHEVVLLFAWVLPEDSTSTYCMNHGRDVALLTRLSGLKNTKISSLVDYRDWRSPTTELKNLKVMFVVMKKFLRVSPAKRNFSERHGNS